MLRTIACLILSVLCLSAPIRAQVAPQNVDVQKSEHDVAVQARGFYHFRHYDCPPLDPATPGATAEHPMDTEFFSRAWANASFADDEPYDAEIDQRLNDGANAPGLFQCRWIRLGGFVTWDNLEYIGHLYENAPASYQPRANMSYFIESVGSGMPPRADIARRYVTLVGRFYDLCAEGRRAMKAEGLGPNWDLGYPCHEIPAMMLADVRIEKIHDATPQYILGEANREVMGSLALATPDQQEELEPVVRAWAASVRRGLKTFADEYLAQYPAWDEEDFREARAAIESRDSYPAHLLRQSRFKQLDFASADVKVFSPVATDDPPWVAQTRKREFNTAIGCICLARSCTDRWPLTVDDAATFLGDAACIALDKRDNRWRW